MPATIHHRDFSPLYVFFEGSVLFFRDCDCLQCDVSVPDVTSVCPVLTEISPTVRDGICHTCDRQISPPGCVFACAHVFCTQRTPPHLWVRPQQRLGRTLRLSVIIASLLPSAILPLHLLLLILSFIFPLLSLFVIGFPAIPLVAFISSLNRSMIPLLSLPLLPSHFPVHSAHLSPVRPPPSLFPPVTCK